MSYSDFLDYWLDNHCKINLKYYTIEAYSNIVKTHLKPNLGFYKLSQITKAEIDVALLKVDFVFVKNNGVYEGTDSTKYPFKVIHYELGIPCRFHDFRDTGEKNQVIMWFINNI